MTMTQQNAANIIGGRPDASREAAQLVLDTYGPPQEATDTRPTWHRPGPWKRLVASRTYYEHHFPAPHIDSAESFIDYQVPPEKFTPLARFDGSVIAERTAVEVSARCHDEQANFLALNLMHDIVTGEKPPEEARDHYAKEFADHRRGRSTPYMERLRFAPGHDTAAPDRRLLSDEDLARAAAEGGG
ncbi:hypothetical protein [Streptomyces litchfieldiae]|uniref:Uncharacterized protein n=1 Tax=Streptomyces litchfieldiae TaxID=3075543 RepID=A0ABU2MXI1_9ACTN|nr:hypothetical protein [Streptomyces sp. DSM 44938]MDT0346368.1 hypothetical protein [Streptomyces sp. DSM 44938]